MTFKTVWKYEHLRGIPQETWIFRADSLRISTCKDPMNFVFNMYASIYYTHIYIYIHVCAETHGFSGNTVYMNVNDVQIKKKKRIATAEQIGQLI